MTDQNLIRVIDTAWDSRSEWKDATVELKDAVETVIAGLDNGTLRVAEKSTAIGSRTSGSKRRCSFLSASHPTP